MTFGLHEAKNEDRALMFWGVDRPVRKAQTDLLLEQLTNEVKNTQRQNKAHFKSITNKWWRHLESIDGDGYGSFRLWFDLAVLEEDDLEALNGDINDHICNTDIAYAMMRWVSLEENLEDEMEIYSANEYFNIVRGWIDDVLACGYSISEDQVVELFADYVPANEIAKEFLMRSLKGERVELTKKSG